MRILQIAVVLVILAGGAVAVLASQSHVLPPAQSAAVKKVSEPVLGIISDSGSTVLQEGSRQLASALNEFPQAATAGGQKIPVDEAAKQIQAQIERLPGDIAERARYDYCRQVVIDYEREHPRTQ